MAQEGDPERRCSDKALKIQALIRGFVGSLFEILNEEDLLEDETNVIGNVLCQTEAELKIQLEQLRLKTDTTSGVASASQTDDRLAGSSLHSKRVIQKFAYPKGEVAICRHFCKDHPELIDISLWETLPAEVAERVCAMLPVSKIFELLDLCKPWSRLPRATNFRQLCAKAHDDLFGILMFSEKILSYRLAVYDPKHEEWSHMEVNSMPFELVMISDRSKLVFGHDGGLICVVPHAFSDFEEPPGIIVFNPLTCDKKYIGVSSFTASIGKEEMYAVLLQLIMDEERHCYKLILVTQRRKRSRGGEYHSESYDSVSGLWSTLDSGFVYGDGVLKHKRYHVCFDCKLKQFCTPAECGKSVRNPHSHIYFTDVDPDYMYDPFYTCVRDHSFKLEFVEFGTEDEIYNFTAEISESVWQNGWHEKSMLELEIGIPYEGSETRLLACSRYVFVVADDGEYADSEDSRQLLALYDRVSCKEVRNIPQFMTGEFRYDKNFMTRNLQFMCDLKWDVVP